jgi:hypothetical protein
MLHRSWYIWVQLPIIALYGGISFGTYQTGDDILLWVIIGVAMWAGTLHSVMEQIHPLDHMPVSRRSLYWHSAGTAIVLAVIGGLVALQAVGQFGPRRPSDIRYDDAEIHVPIEFWETAGHGGAPVVEAPWGERYRPEVIHHFLDEDIGIYNPFGSDRESSPRFIAWQMRRAAIRVYGDAVPADWPGDPGDPGEAYRAGIEKGDHTPEELRGYHSVVRSRVYAVALLLLALTLTPAILLTLGRQSARATTRGKNAMWVTGLGLFILVVGVLLSSDVGRREGSRAVYGYPMILLRRWAEHTDLSAGLLWAGTIAVVVACLLVLQWRFGRLEAVTSRIAKTRQEDI